MRSGLSLLPLLLLIACEPDPEDSAKLDDTNVEGWTLEDLGGSCGYDDHLGTFEIAHWDGPDEGFATVTGEVLDGVVPITVLGEVATASGCTLWQKVNPFCEQPCEPDEACNHDGECVPYPQAQDVGTVTIQGLEHGLALEPDAFGSYWDTSVGYPLFQPGAQVLASAPGWFELRGLGVERIVVPEDASWLLTEGQDMAVSWAPASQGQGLVEITFNIDQHGTSPLTMVCTLPDTGSASVPGDLLDLMRSAGVSGYPSSWIRRVSADSVEIPGGCADLLLYSHRAVELSVDGHTPCNGDPDCPDGQHCDMERQTCVDDET
jgi:hypothetical protein